MSLSKTDELILASYVNVVYDLAGYLGRSYEIVLHSLDDFEHSVVAIVNGEHTGRAIGAPITDRALEMLDHLSKGEPATPYFSTNRAGDPLKSTTIPVRGEEGRIIGLLCINRYLNTPVIDLVHELVPAAEQALPETAPKRQLEENFASNADELIASMVERTRTAVFDDDAVLPSNRNKEIVNRLNRQGVFRFKDAVVIVAQQLDISRNTVYMHLRSARKSDQSDEG